MNVEVLRLGHRFSRDKRLTTHVALTARAFGAGRLILDSKDSHLMESVESVVDNWGGGFRIDYTDNWKNTIRDFKGVRIHLTMYGINVDDALSRLDDDRDKLIVIGGQKVPPEVYELVDYNIAVGNQPHSEVAALAILMDRLFKGTQFNIDFKGKRTVVPQERGKMVVQE
ncbi:MAG: tRNA (cytidine(56)-2'-O)-methyltransferase [Candidatus Altiarchaeota archaeon]